jgi:hypothetical protein
MSKINLIEEELTKLMEAINSGTNEGRRPISTAISPNTSFGPQFDFYYAILDFQGSPAEARCYLDGAGRFYLV